MGKLTVLFVALVPLLVVLQFGAETNAAPVPVPPLSCQTGYYSMPYIQPTYVYRQPQPIYYNYAPQQYQYPPIYSQPTIPYISPGIPTEFEGLYSTNTIVGDNNIQFTGVDILGNVNAPANVLSITDVL